MEYPIIIREIQSYLSVILLLHNSLILFITYDFSITNNITALFYN